jgi:ABC-type Fe3+/spermidine/putrescine transport system ATPase subunit
MSVVKKLFRKLNHFEIDIKDWQIPDQGITVLWGPSGSGKTTVVNSLIGLDSQAQVSWFFKDQDLAQVPTSQRGLSVVFQDLGLFPHMTARENILFPVVKKKHPHWQKDFDFLVTSLELEACLKQKTPSLSGGEQQRVALARALIYRPQMLFLDEAFSSLDESLRQQARQVLKKLITELQCPVLLITHDRQDVLELADRVCEIEKGRLVREGSELLTPSQ